MLKKTTVKLALSSQLHLDRINRQNEPHLTAEEQKERQFQDWIDRHLKNRNQTIARHNERKREEKKLKRKTKPKRADSTGDNSDAEVKRKKKVTKKIGQMFLEKGNQKIVQANKDNIVYYNQIYENLKSEKGKLASLARLEMMRRN